MINFALVGSAGYIAPRHMKAIKDIECNLVACHDPSDSMGIIDRYFPECCYFKEFHRFDRYLCKNYNVDYLVVCSPNHTHDFYCRYGLSINADVICEKPTTLMVKNICELSEHENDNFIYTIMQSRLHPAIKDLKKTYVTKQEVYVDYVAPRGKWYDYSWKGDTNKSGGIVYNIGIHIFDLLIYLFGWVEDFSIIHCDKRNISGVLVLKYANVGFNLSIDGDEPKRGIIINKEEVDFTCGFEDLHTLSYINILNGDGFTLEDVKPSIKLCEDIVRAVKKDFKY